MADPKDYMCVGLKNVEVVKQELNGYSFIIEDCTACDIRLLDRTSQVQIDGCVDCTIVVGPVAGSIFLRDCRRCTFLICGQQLRTRDCEDISLFTHLVTRPVIEQTKDCLVAPWTILYENADNHMLISDVNPDPDVWNKVYDFSPTWEPNATHWRVMDSADARRREQEIIGAFAQTNPLAIPAVPAAPAAAAPVAVAPAAVAPAAAAPAALGARRREGPCMFTVSRKSSLAAQVSIMMNILRADQVVCLVGEGMAISRATDMANGLRGTEITQMQTALHRGRARLEITVRIAQI
eukprot:GEMP01053427.1.p1 GENE.GEMP01053427.1~~GEMP01053427.1.p1  ORF type:complete len:294 (+),score=75.40 GEMP01053427.1:275-1156(+)